MGQEIGNVGLLNLTKATEKSISGINKIENVGMILYTKDNKHLISRLNIRNIGQSVEVPEEYSVINGKLTINKGFLDNLEDPANLFVNGAVIIEKDVEPEQLKQGLLQLLVNGIVYAPIHLTGLVNNLFAEGKTSINGYEGEAPRFENGEFTLTNAFLEAGGIDQYIVINGHLRFAKDLNMEKYEEKIKKLEINGIVTIYANQEMYFHKKVTSTNSQLITIIPDGYEVIDKKLHVNARNIRRFQNKKIYTKRPIILDKDISRDALSKAITSIESTSFVVCHESLEDLLYEITSNMKTEILPYDDSYILIEGEETWSKEELLALESATNFIIKGKLIFQQDVDRDVLMAKVASLDNFGVVAVNDTKLKGTLQSVLRVNNGEIRESGKQVERSVLKNVGELSL